MSERKMVRRSVAIALGIVCIVLITGLGGAMAYYTMIVADLQNQVNSLQKQVNDLAVRPSLNSPDDGLQAACIGMVFRCNVTCVGDSIQNASLWLNASGAWQRVAWNTTVVQNNTENMFAYYFNSIGTYVWNVQVYSTKTDAFASLNRTLTVYSPSVRITSAVKKEWWYSTFHEFNFTVQVANNGSDAVDGAVVVIRLYHDPMMISWPVTMYTNEVQVYYGTGNTLHVGTIPAGGNVPQSTFISVYDFYPIEGGQMAVPIKYAEATIFLGDSILDKQTLDIDPNQSSQTWIYP
jgi:hypothetical protein